MYIYRDGGFYLMQPCSRRSRNIYFCHSSQIPIKASPTLRDSGNDGSAGV